VFALPGDPSRRRGGCASLLTLIVAILVAALLLSLVTRLIVALAVIAVAIILVAAFWSYLRRFL
jgi:hypothetical protein